MESVRAPTPRRMITDDAGARFGRPSRRKEFAKAGDNRLALIDKKRQVVARNTTCPSSAQLSVLGDGPRNARVRRACGHVHASFFPAPVRAAQDRSMRAARARTDTISLCGSAAWDGQGATD